MFRLKCLVAACARRVMLVRVSRAAVFSAFITLVTAISFPGSAANASSVIFSDFGPGNSYSCCSGWNVFGPSSGDGYADSAMLFNSAIAADVSQIDIALSHSSGITNAATISLWTNASGALGTQLGSSWSVSNFPTFGLSSSSVVTISGISGVHLDAGVSYFLYATAPGDAETIWNWNSVGAVGTTLSFCCGLRTEQTLGAFDILSDSVSATPLPAALPLFVGGLGVIGLLARRRKRRAAVAFA